MSRFLRRWPLLGLGLVCLAAAVSLADPVDASDARALLFGVACVLVGAGLVLVVRGDDDDDDER